MAWEAHLNQRQVDRFRESREKRERSITKLKELLLKEVWETASQVHDRPSRVHPPPVEVEPAPPPKGLSTQTKQVISAVALALATAIVSALTASGATKPHELPKTTQPGP